LSHGLSSTSGDPEPEGPPSLEVSTGGGPGTVREGVGELSGVVAVHDANGPWGQPLGPMEICTVRRIIGGPTGPTTTEIWWPSSSSSSLPSSSP
jgi:hypothetical protein